MSLRIVLNFPGKPLGDTLPPAPDGYAWYRVLHDDEKNEKFREGLPETVKLVEDVQTLLTPIWQEYQFDLLRSKRPAWSVDRLINAWASLTKDRLCFTDFSAVQNGRADYIQHINEDAEGIGWHTIVCGGNAVLCSQMIFRKGGENCRHIITMDGRKSPGSIWVWNGTQFNSRPGEVGMIVATTRARETLVVNDRVVHYVNPFPQLIDRLDDSYTDVPVLLISPIPNYIRDYQIASIQGNTRPSPYVPSRFY